MYCYFTWLLSRFTYSRDFWGTFDNLHEGHVTWCTILSSRKWARPKGAWNYKAQLYLKIFGHLWFFWDSLLAKKTANSFYLSRPIQQKKLVELKTLLQIWFDTNLNKKLYQICKTIFGHSLPISCTFLSDSLQRMKLWPFMCETESIWTASHLKEMICEGEYFRKWWYISSLVHNKIFFVSLTTYLRFVLCSNRVLTM